MKAFLIHPTSDKVILYRLSDTIKSIERKGYDVTDLITIASKFSESNQYYRIRQEMENADVVIVWLSTSSSANESRDIDLFCVNYARCKNMNICSLATALEWPDKISRFQRFWKWMMNLKVWSTNGNKQLNYQ